MEQAQRQSPSPGRFKASCCTWSIPKAW
jgi:hypothetical protein